MIDQDRIDAIWARVEAASPGTWVVGWTGISESWVAFCDQNGERSPGTRTVTSTDEGDTEFCEADAEFIAHARQDIPYLLEAITELHAVIGILEGHGGL